MKNKAHIVSNLYFEEKIDANIKKIIKNYNISFSKVAVAVSGGCDSLSLVIVMHRLGYDVLAILVNHNLREEAKMEIETTAKTLEKIGIKYVITEWEGKVVKNLEAEARKARYDILFNVCKKNNINVLLIGHHLNDQVETFLLNLSRGSGIDGLSAMPEVNTIDGICIVRLMLNICKKDCKDYLIGQNISWCEDGSNNDTKYKRNKIRNMLCNLEDKDLIEKRISNTIILLQEVRTVVEDVLNNVILNNVKFADDFCTFDRVFFLKQRPYIQKSLLSFCITKLSNREYKMRLYQIENIIDNIYNKDCFKQTIAKCIISWKKNTIVIKKWQK